MSHDVALQRRAPRLSLCPQRAHPAAAVADVLTSSEGHKNPCIAAGPGRGTPEHCRARGQARFAGRFQRVRDPVQRVWPNFTNLIGTERIKTSFQKAEVKLLDGSDCDQNATGTMFQPFKSAGLTAFNAYTTMERGQVASLASVAQPRMSRASKLHEVLFGKGIHRGDFFLRLRGCPA